MRSPIRSLAVVLLAVSLIALSAQTLKASDAELQVIGQAYLANIEAFDSVSCEFVITMGNARDDREALARGPVRNLTKAHGIWVRGRGVERGEIKRNLRQSPPDVTTIGGKRTMSVRLPPQTILRDRDSALSVSGVTGFGVVGERSLIDAEPSYTPWNFLGEAGENECFSLGSLISNYLGASDRVFSLERGAAPHPELARVDIMSTDQAQGGWVFFVDEDRGCIPREVWCQDANMSNKMYVPDVKECSNGRWFPTRVLVCSPVRGSTGGVFVKEMRITKLDADRPPSADELTVLLSAGTVLNTGKGVGEQFALNAGRRVAISDIPALVAMASEAAIARAGGTIPQTTAEDAAGWRPWIIAANVLLVVAVAGYLLRRSNR